MAIKKQIDISVDARSAIKDMDELGSSFEDVFGEIKPLNTKIGEMEDALYQLAAAGDTSSKEFKDLSRQIGDYKKVIIDTDLKIDGMAQTTAQNLGGALGGVTAGFELGTGAMGAFGVESDKVQAALLRVQSAMAISQGIQGIRESIPSFRKMGDAIANNEKVQKLFNFAVGGGTKAVKLLRVALVSVGIGAIVAGITALVANFSKLKDFITGTTESTRMLNGVMKEAAKATASEKASLDTLLKTARNENLSKKERTKAVKELNKLSPKYLGNITLENIKTQDSVKAIDKYINALDAKAMAQAISNQKAKLYEKQIENQTSALKDNFGVIDALNESTSDLTLGFRLLGEKLGFSTGATDRLTAAAKRNKKESGENIQSQLDALDNLIQKKIETGEVSLGDFALNTDTGAGSDDDKKVVQEQEKEVIPRLKTLKFQEIEIAKQTSLQLVQIKKDEVKQKLEQENLFHAGSHKMRMIAQSEEFAMTEKGLSHSMTALNSLQALSDAVTENELAKAGDDEEKKEKIRKKAFERNKKLQITMAIVQGIQGVMAAFTAGSSMGPAGVIMGPLMAALAAATAAINVAKISKTKYQSTSVPSADTPRALSPSSVPQFNIAGNSPSNQLAQTLGTEEQQPVKAFVVAGDVTTAQSLERDKVELSGL